MKCGICANNVKKVFNHRVLNKYIVSYYHCARCGFIQTEDPFWIEEAYSSAIAESDTGVMVRNVSSIGWASPLIYLFFGKDMNYLDWGGGYGIFVRLMRDNGFNFFWKDKYSQNLLARGFEYRNQRIELCTALEVFEHFKNPLKEIEDMLQISDNILFTTNLLPTDIPEKDWWYYCFETGQHISLYSHRTLVYIARRYNLNLYSYKNVHLLTRKYIQKELFYIVMKLTRLNIQKLVKKMMSQKTEADMHLIIQRQKCGDKNEY